MKILNFDKIRNAMEERGVVVGSGVNTTFRTISFPVDRNYKYGSIVLLEFYEEEKGFLCNL